MLWKNPYEASEVAGLNDFNLLKKYRVQEFTSVAVASSFLIVLNILT